MNYHRVLVNCAPTNSQELMTYGINVEECTAKFSYRDATRTTIKKPKDLILAERCIAIIIVIHLQRGNCNIKYKSLLLTRPQKADATNRKQTSAEKINPAL